MKFMMTMQCRQADWETMGTWSPEELRAHIAFMVEFAERLVRDGELVLAEGLDVPANARIVRAVGDGPPAITEGPFAETKEFLAGFWIVDVASPERAVELAAHASSAPGPGGEPMGIPIELRRVMDGPPEV